VEILAMEDGEKDVWRRVELFDILPISAIPLVLGNVLHDDFEELWGISWTYSLCPPISLKNFDSIALLRHHTAKSFKLPTFPLRQVLEVCQFHFLPSVHRF
jgi:hypothetical protein